jgi:ABC-type transport system involved in multi-copper enzyme maturation permease subunit
MIWLTWRQLRLQTVIAGAALLVLAVYLTILGLAMRSSYDADVAGCSGDACGQLQGLFRDQYASFVYLTGGLVIAVPAILGMFWAAPLVAREFDTGTYRMVWTQSVSRQRWLAVKLAIVTALGLAVTGVFTLLLTWSAQPFDGLEANRFGILMFGSRDIAPFGYAAFALALGTTVGLLVRRTLPAVAVTLVVFAVLQVVTPLMIRPHLMPPVTTSVPVSEESLRGAGLGLRAAGPGAVTSDSPVLVFDYSIADAWMLTNESRMLQASGAPADGLKARDCFQAQGQAPAGKNEGRDPAAACLAAMNLHFDVKYQPADRYWRFQMIETGAYCGLALLLGGFSLWRIRRGLG